MKTSHKKAVIALLLLVVLKPISNISTQDCDPDNCRRGTLGRRP
ncbi:hypothetical protein [Nostoc sp. C052]|nr:hypothetical protein [Nostoc sp. C052]